MGVVMKVSEETISSELEEIAAAVTNKTDVLVAFAEYFHRVMMQALNMMTYRKLWPNGATFRGNIFWKGPAPKHTRKDGTRVPPWGQIASVVGPKRQLLGRLRPSGARVTPFSRMMQDTGNMIQAFLTAPAIGPTKDYIVFSVENDYAVEQNDMRPFDQFVPEDQSKLDELYRSWLVALYLAKQRYGTQGQGAA